MKLLLRLFILPVLLLVSGAALSEEPLWIWHTKAAADNEVRYFRKEFMLEALPTEAILRASGDDEIVIFLNGHDVGASDAWQNPVTKHVDKLLQRGPNVLAVRGKNQSGAAAVVLRLDLKMANGAKQAIMTDGTWKSAENEAPNWKMPGFNDLGWRTPVALGKLGDDPWGNVFAGGGGGAGNGKSGTAAADLETVPGFEVQMVLNADPAKHGSWICMAKDDAGRLLLGSQTGNKITRLTLKDGQVIADEDLQLPFGEPMGMLWVDHSLLINGDGKSTDGKHGHGIYRCWDTKGDGHFDRIEQLYEWKGGQGGGEHGSHGVVLGPDHKLYVVNGNFVDPPADLLPTSPHRNYADDLVLGRAEDGNGFGAGRKPPGGFILRLDLDGKNPELFAAGERNTYDIAFNADGELFGFDSDMEWDWGTPWYRPIRIFHAPSGADQGFREGTGKWPTYYPDSLPPIVNIGIGSPTGVVFGAGAKFPAKYQRAFFVLDWTYGRLIAAHLQPNGATYSATWENFVAPRSLNGGGPKRPLDLTDALVGDDGALYFTVGGRGTQASLYRVRYTGAESTAPADLHDPQGKEARALRHQLEAFQGKQEKEALAVAWPHLGDPDRFLRYAARLAIESQPVEQWRDRALNEAAPEAALTALLALARLGGKEAQPALFAALAKLPLSGMKEEQQLEKIRVVEVSIARNGAPAGAEAVASELEALFPSASIPLNRELCQTLLALNSPKAVAKTMALMAAAPTQEEQLTYLLALRNVKSGWTPELHRQYFAWWVRRPPSTHPDYVVKWFQDAGREYGDGASFAGFLQNLHTDAERTLTAEEIDQLQPVLAGYVPPNARPPRKATKAHAFVKVWQMADLDPALGEATHGRNFENGRDGFAAGQCILCHRFGDEGGAVGPDLTAIAARYSLHDILESIIDPSKVISEQYANEELTLKNGETAVGRVISETKEKIVLRPSLLAPQTQEVKTSDVRSHQLSKVSPMPPALLSTFTREDVLDLLAFLASGGKKDAPAFAK